MKQETLDLFVAETVPPERVWKEPAPIAPSSDLTARHCRSMGAKRTEQTRHYLWAEMLKCYERQSHTDAEIAYYLTWALEREHPIPPSTISARRKELIQQGKVDPKSCGTRKNERTGVSNSLWQLTKER